MTVSCIWVGIAVSLHSPFPRLCTSVFPLQPFRRLRYVAPDSRTMPLVPPFKTHFPREFNAKASTLVMVMSFGPYRCTDALRPSQEAAFLKLCDDICADLMVVTLPAQRRVPSLRCSQLQKLLVGKLFLPGHEKEWQKEWERVCLVDETFGLDRSLAPLFQELLPGAVGYAVGHKVAQTDISATLLLVSQPELTLFQRVLDYLEDGSLVPRVQMIDTELYLAFIKQEVVAMQGSVVPLLPDD